MSVEGLIICSFRQYKVQILSIFVTCSLIFVSASSLAVDFDKSKILPPEGELDDTQALLPWIEWKTNEYLSVKYRKIENKALIEIKSQVTIKSSISGFILFIQDTKNITHWLENANFSNVLEQPSPQKNTFVTHFNSFWPIKQRYLVVSSHYWQNPDLTLEITITDNKLEKHLVENKIKVDVLKAHWLVTRQENNNITIEYSFIADPKGNLPFWLIKRLQLNSIWKTMNMLKEQLPKSMWQSHKLPHIIETKPKK